MLKCLIVMKKDLRVEKTETAIEQAFLELIEEKGFANVHLVDIALKANVNRNTIYIRYGTKEDIISSIVSKTFESHKSEVDIKDIMKLPLNRRVVDKFFTTIFTVIDNDQELYRIILTDPNLSGYIDKLVNDIRKIMLSSFADTKKNRVIIEYILQGFYGVIKTWIIYDTGSIEENVKILASLVMSNVRHLQMR